MTPRRWSIWRRTWCALFVDGRLLYALAGLSLAVVLLYGAVAAVSGPSR